MLHLLLLLVATARTFDGDVAPGTLGWGLTVFQGVAPDTFGVEILGTLRGVVPEEDRILVRLTGPLAERTGVASGMSGSPVYVGDRLLGALSSTFPFASEPFGVVTPIAAMLAPQSSGMPAGIVPVPMTGSAVGFDPSALEALSARLPAPVAFAGGGRAQTTTDLQPGQVSAAVLVEGDWVLSIVGTVTWRSGDRVALFGHQLFGLGEVELPLAGGSVVATLPNRALSFKMSSAGPVIGSITFDGGSGVLGRIGTLPKTLPLAISTIGRSPRTFDLALAVHPQLTPLLVRTCVLNCGSIVGGSGAGTVAATVRARFPDGSRRVAERAASGAGALVRLAEDVAGLLEALMTCPLGRVVPESLSVTLAVSPEQPAYYLESVVVDDGARAGAQETMVTVRLVTREQVALSRTVRLRLPEGRSAGTVRLEVADAATTAQWDKERAALAHAPITVERYVDQLFSPRVPRTLYLRIITDRKTWTRREGEVIRLPRSMGAVLGRASQRGRHEVGVASVVSTAEIMLDGPVYGSAVVDLSPSKEGRPQ